MTMTCLSSKVIKIKAYFEERDLDPLLRDKVDINLKFIDIPAFQISALKNLTRIGLVLEGKNDEFIKRYLNGKDWQHIDKDSLT